MAYIAIAFVVQSGYAVLTYFYFLRVSVLKVDLAGVLHRYTSEKRHDALCPIASAGACSLAGFVVFSVVGCDQLVNLIRGSITWEEATQAMQ